MSNQSTEAGAPRLTCPFCEAGDLLPFGRVSVRCESCEHVLGGQLLEALRQIVSLPDVVGRHPCECGHPEMRALPDGVFWCPACGSEVLPVDTPAVVWKSKDRSEAYWCGWLDGRFGEVEDFTRNTRLARWEECSDRLDYYRGHRAGRLARLARRAQSTPDADIPETPAA